MAAALGMGAAAVVAQKKVFVGGLSWETDERSLRDYFGKYGQVSDCVIMRDRNTGHPRGFGFVTYDDRCHAERAAAERHELDGRQVEAKMAVPRSECTPTARTHVTRATKKVFVGGLPATCGDVEFRDYFVRFGEIAECQVMYDHQTGNSRGFGFVTFTSEATVDRVVEMDKHDIMGKLVEVKRAEPKQVLEARRGREAAAAMAHASAPSSLLISPPKQQPAQPQHPQTQHQTAQLQQQPHQAHPQHHQLPQQSQLQQQQQHIQSQQPAQQQSQQQHISSSLAPYLQTLAPSNSTPVERAPPAQSLFSTFGTSTSPFSSAPGSSWNSLLSSSSGFPSSGFASAGFPSLAPASATDTADVNMNSIPQPSAHTDQAAPWRSNLGGVGGMGFFSPAQPYSQDLAQVVHNVFYGVTTASEALGSDLAGAVPSQRVDRRFHPYPNRERIERSYR